jgi:hypothetical protein
MNEEKIVLQKVRLSFGSFLLYMVVAGLSTAIVSTFFDIIMALYKMAAGDPNIAGSDFVKPFLSIVIDPIDAVISGAIIYPLYKFFRNRYFTIGIKLWKINDS